MDEQSPEANLLATKDRQVQKQQCVVDKLSQELQYHEEACKDLEVRMKSLAKLKAYLDTARVDHGDLQNPEDTRALAAQVLAKYEVQVEAEDNRQQVAQAAAQKLPALSQALESAKERLQVLVKRRAAARKCWKELSACVEKQRQQRQTASALILQLKPNCQESMCCTGAGCSSPVYFCPTPAAMCSQCPPSSTHVAVCFTRKVLWH